MDIAIIGAGNVGTALATCLHPSRPRRHDRVARSRRMPAGRRRGDGPTIATSNARGAQRSADVVVLAIPFASCRRTSPPRSPTPSTGKAVVDVTNRISFGPSGPEIDTTSSNAEAIAALLPDGQRRQGVQHALRAPTRPIRSSRASSSTDSSPVTTPTPRRRSSSSSRRSGSIRSTSARSAAPASSRASRSSTWRSTSPTTGPGSRAGSSSARPATVPVARLTTTVDTAAVRGSTLAR